MDINQQNARYRMLNVFLPPVGTWTDAKQTVLDGMIEAAANHDQRNEIMQQAIDKSCEQELQRYAAECRPGYRKAI